MTQTLEQNRIESLRRTIKEKKQALGLTGDLLSWKGFKRYSDLSLLTYPESLRKYRYHLYLGKTEAFNEHYLENLTIGKHRYVFDHLVEEIAKYFMVSFHPVDDETYDDVSCRIQDFMREQTCFPAGSFEVVEDTDSDEANYVKRIFQLKAKKEISTVWRLSCISPNDEVKSEYTTFDLRVPKKLRGRWSNQAGDMATITDFSSMLAKAALIHLTAKHLTISDITFNQVLDRLETEVSFDRDRLCQWDYEDFILHFLANNMHFSDLIKSVIVYSFTDLISEFADIQGIEERFIQRSTTHATAYMTKKNIPLKIQKFMADNHFLAMFGEVEADELCDLDKLYQLAEEFKTLSTLIPFPIAKDHTLRFRRLGRHKAAGLYYPFFQTLAIDIDSPHSFVHEWFHFVDYEHDLLSANAEFRPLLNLYRQQLDSSFEALGKEDLLYQRWFSGKSKYSRGYYLSSEEAFARLGECYVANILGIDSSFNRRDLTSKFEQLVYPSTPELNEAIQAYFKPLFNRIKEEATLVSFEEEAHLSMEPASKIEKPKTVPVKYSTIPSVQAVATPASRSHDWKAEPVRVIEQLSLGI